MFVTAVFKAIRVVSWALQFGLQAVDLADSENVRVLTVCDVNKKKLCVRKKVRTILTVCILSQPIKNMLTLKVE